MQTIIISIKSECTLIIGDDFFKQYTYLAMKEKKGNIQYACIKTCYTTIEPKQKEQSKERTLQCIRLKT